MTTTLSELIERLQQLQVDHASGDNPDPEVFVRLEEMRVANSYRFLLSKDVETDNDGDILITIRSRKP